MSVQGRHQLLQPVGKDPNLMREMPVRIEQRQLENGDADLIALARAVLYDPHWPWHAAASLGAQVRVPSQYLRSEPHGLKGTLLPNR